MLTVFVHRDRRTEQTQAVEPAWVAPGAEALVWVDFESPTPDEARVLREVFHFHELAIEDALSDLHHPKVERYDDFLYVILHGVRAAMQRDGQTTHDIDFFLGARFLVTVHHGSRSVRAVQELCRRSSRAMDEGLPAIMHRVIDRMVDNYEPEIARIDDDLGALEREALSDPRADVVRRIMEVKRQLAWLRRVTQPQRDVVARLSRREFPEIDDQIAYRFRDVQDHLVRVVDETLAFEDRLTSVLDAHFSATSTRLNEVMKVLTIIATIFIPLSVLTGAFGMNVPLPELPGGPDAQFWWISGIMFVVMAAMLWVFRRRRWL